MVEISHYSQMNDSPEGVRLTMAGHSELMDKGFAPSEVIIHYSHKLLVARLDGAAVGVMVWDEHRHVNDCFIQLSYVHPWYRRRGVYREMYAALVDKAREMKLRTVTSGVTIGNEPMFKAAERMGRKPYATYFRSDI